MTRVIATINDVYEVKIDNNEGISMLDVTIDYARLTLEGRNIYSEYYTVGEVEMEKKGFRYLVSNNQRTRIFTENRTKCTVYGKDVGDTIVDRIECEKIE